MTIKEWKRHFKGKVKPASHFRLKNGDLIEMNSLTIDSQLNEMKKAGQYKVYYFKFEQLSNTIHDANLKLISQEIVVDETQYL